MITDIYLKHVNDPAYNEEAILETQEFEVLLSQIKMTLLTPNNSVLGFPEFGVDEESALFNFSDSYDLTKLEASLRFQLKKYCTLLRNRDWEVSAKIVPDGVDQYRDVVHVLLTVDKNATFVIAYD